MAGRNGRTVRDLRRGNRTAVLRRLYFDGPMSRFELGPATGLSSGSVSNVVAELVGDGLVEEAGSVDSDGGRPRTLLRVAPTGGHMIGVDVGETRVRVGLFDLTLTELARAERPLEHRGYDVDGVVGHIRDGVAEVLAAAEIAPERLLGVGVGVPGIVERTPARGAVVHGQTIGWDAVPLESLLRTACQLPHSVPYYTDNGAKTLGQAEMWFGAGRGAHSAVVVLFGSGVGACLVSDDAEHGRAVEWGHLTVRVRGRRCRCGAFGCLEAYAGAEALLDRWREEGGKPPEGVDEESALAAMLAAAHPAEGEETDPVAVAVLEEAAEYMGAGLSDLINLFQPERILIGGWAGLRLGPRFLPAVREHAVSYALGHPAQRVTIGLGTLGTDAVTVGAASLPLADFFARGGRGAGSVAGEAQLPMARGSGGAGSALRLAGVSAIALSGTRARSTGRFVRRGGEHAVTDHRKEGAEEAGGPVPRDLPDQQVQQEQVQEGQESQDHWDVIPADPRQRDDTDEDGTNPDSDIPDTDEAGTGRQGAPRSGTVHPEHPGPEESPA